MNKQIFALLALSTVSLIALPAQADEALIQESFHSLLISNTF